MRWSSLFFALLLSAAATAAQPVAIVGGTVHTGTGAPLEGATVLFDDGRIVAVGRDVAVPEGARRIDAAGKVVTPGLFNSHTQIGIVEINAVEDTRDVRTEDDRLSAAFAVADALDPFSSVIPVTATEGVTRAVVAPDPGESLIAGQGAVIHLGVEEPIGPDTLLVRSPVAMFAVLGAAGAELAGGTRSAALVRLEEALEDARDFAAHRQAWEAGDRRSYALSRLDLEALVPVVEGELPLAVHVNRASDLLTTLRLAEEHGLELILLGAAEGWRVAEAIARAGVPVVVDPLTNIPRFDNLAATLENAARLHAAGVRVAFATFDTHNARTLKQAAGNAVAYGMPYQAALAAVTRVPAEVWGIAESYGTLAPGMDADVVVWGGDPFELLTPVGHVFVRGREVPRETRQQKLFERYRRLDDPLPPAWRKP